MRSNCDTSTYPFNVSGVESQTPQQYSALLSPNASILKDLEPLEPSRPSGPIRVSLDKTSTSYSTATRIVAPTSKDVQYSQLSKDVEVVGKDGAGILSSNEVEGTPSPTEANRSFVSPLLPGRAAHSLASKVKGLVFSYLPRSPKTAPTKKPKPKPAANGPVLPVPPSEVFKKPRPPITTPAPKPVEKLAPAKALVQLHRVPPPKLSMIPRPSQQQPQRWVQLNPVPSRPSSSTGFNSSTVRERRDSGASVKDLVKTFETMEKMQVADRESRKQLELKRNKSIKQWSEVRTAKSSKPVWRP